MIARRSDRHAQKLNARSRVLLLVFVAIKRTIERAARGSLLVKRATPILLRIAIGIGVVNSTRRAPRAATIAGRTVFE
jgi:hypothetical protein